MANILQHQEKRLKKQKKREDETQKEKRDDETEKEKIDEEIDDKEKKRGRN